jgi:hypothetical protein
MTFWRWVPRLWSIRPPYAKAFKISLKRPLAFCDCGYDHDYPIRRSSAFQKTTTASPPAKATSTLVGKVSAPANGIPDHVGRSFSPLGLRSILVLDLGNGISGFAKSNQHSLGEMNTFFVTFRDLVPRRAVPRTGMINESGFDGACYDDKGVFGHLGFPLLSAKHITLLAGTMAQRHHAQASQSSALKPTVTGFVTSVTVVAAFSARSKEMATMAAALS